MQTTTSLVIPARLHSLAATAALLEKLDRQPREASAEQYRAVVAQLSTLLGQASPDKPLNELLRVFPAAAELYENLQYAHAGLCRHDLDAALAAEQQATALIDRIRHSH